ncbi:MAG TPA: crossover junction endodeoxyribonuclease RuvC [Chloroflexota bacterium]|nr:crossover junction endodeoxyribonuclease RuvC [Chloroflexota bacterium]
MTTTRCALGVDPGTARMGYAVIRQDGGALVLLTCGVFETSSSLALSERLAILYAGLLQVIDEFRPTEVAIEDLFFNRNVRSALSVGQARGVALLAAAHRGLAVYDYTPLHVKQSIAGFGRARKEQIQEMVRVLLGLTSIPQPDDAADAAAIAVCHLNSAAGRDLYKSLMASKDW